LTARGGRREYAGIKKEKPLKTLRRKSKKSSGKRGELARTRSAKKRNYGEKSVRHFTDGKIRLKGEREELGTKESLSEKKAKKEKRGLQEVISKGPSSEKKRVPIQQKKKKNKSIRVKGVWNSGRRKRHSCRHLALRSAVLRPPTKRVKGETAIQKENER